MERTVSDGMEQTLAYMDRCAAHEGRLAAFGRTPSKPWDSKVFQREAAVSGKAAHAWRVKRRQPSTVALKH